MSTVDELQAQLETMEGWRVTLAAEINDPAFEALGSALREYMRLEYTWIYSTIDALRTRISLLQA